MSWSDKYKRSINCDSPSGFSQKAHCAARKKRQKGEETKSKSPFNEMHEVKSHKTVEKIAKKHRMEVSFIKNQLKMGVPIEHEHTKDKDLATDIALQHLDEIPDYYTRLKKMEASAKKEHKKFKDVKINEGSSNPRIPKKSGQPDKSDKHSDLYTDEDPVGTIQGLGFKDVATAKKSVSKIKTSGRSHAHKIQAAIAMEQRAKVAGKSSEAAVYRKFINSMKEKTKEMNEEGLRDWFGKSKSKDGKPGWVQSDGSPCANEPGETKTPKCFSRSKLASMSKGEIASAVRRKRQQDPGQQQKTGAAKPTFVSTDSPKKKMNEESDKKGKGSGTKDACYHKVKSRYSVWPSAYASGALVKCRKVGAANWGTKSEAMQMMRYCPKCKKDETRDECKYGVNYWDMYSLPMGLGKKYTPNTPHPGNMPEGYDHEYSMARSELSTIITAAKRLRKKMAKGEGEIEAWVQSKITKAADYIDAAADYVDSGEMKEEVASTDTPLDKKPFDVAVKKIMKKNMPTLQRIRALKQAGKLQGVDEQMLPPIDPEEHKKAQKMQKIYNKGTSTDNPNEKEIFLKRTGPQLPLAKKETKTQVAHYEPEGEVIDEKCWPGYKKKGMKTMFGKRYPNCVKAEGFSNWREEMGLNEDWQKVNRQDKTDGLSPAAVKAYRRENPGSKLQTAVTEKKPKGKRAKRRANFCRRMKGMKDKLTSAKTARDPDSRINKALRRWNCN